MSKITELLATHAKDEFLFQSNQANLQLFLGFQLTALALVTPEAAIWAKFIREGHGIHTGPFLTATIMFLEGYFISWFFVTIQMCHFRYKLLETFAPDLEAAIMAEEERSRWKDKVLRSEIATQLDDIVTEIVRIRMGERIREVTSMYRIYNKDKKSVQRYTAFAILVMLAGLVFGMAQKPTAHSVSIHSNFF